MRIHDAADVQYLLKKTGRVLSPNQRIVVMLYASSEQRPDGTVMIKTSTLAATAGMTPQKERCREAIRLWSRIVSPRVQQRGNYHGVIIPSWAGADAPSRY